MKPLRIALLLLLLPIAAAAQSPSPTNTPTTVPTITPLSVNDCCQFGSGNFFSCSSGLACPPEAGGTPVSDASCFDGMCMTHTPTVVVSTPRPTRTPVNTALPTNTKTPTAVPPTVVGGTPIPGVPSSHVHALELTLLKANEPLPLYSADCIARSYSAAPPDYCRCVLFVTRIAGVDALKLKCPDGVIHTITMSP